VLTGLVRAVATGSGGTVWIDGEPGIGKSALVSTVIAQAEQLRLRVCAGAAERLESRLPFAAVGSCLGVASSSRDARLAGIAKILRGKGGVDEPLQSRQDVEIMVTEALVALVDDWCAAEPLVITLDDVQWADPASVLVVHLLGRASTQLPLLLVLACRVGQFAEEITALRESILGRPEATEIRLAPLEDPAATDLARSLLGARPGRRLSALLAGAAGNPLYIGELVSALQHGRELRMVAGVADLSVPAGRSGPAPGLPVTLAATIRGRLEFLSRETRDALRMAALLGSAFDLSELAMVSGRPVRALLDSMTEATRTRILGDSAGRFAFRHDLIRQALLDEMPPAVRTAVHFQAAQALVDSDAPVERIGTHLLAGGVLDGWARSWLVRSVDQLLVRAPALAVDLLAGAVEQVPAGDALRDRLRAKLASALWWSGRFEEAEGAARGALATNQDPLVAPEIRHVLLHAPFWRGRPDIALAEAESALATPGLSAADRRKIECRLAVDYASVGRHDDANELAARILSEAIPGGDDEAAAAALQALTAVNHQQGHFEEAARHAQRGVTILANNGRFEPYLTLGLQVTLAAVLTELDRTTEANDVLREAYQVAERVGGATRALYLGLSGLLRYRAGRWDDALVDIEAGLGIEEYRDDYYRLVQDGYGLAALMAVRRGDAEAARAWIARATTGSAGSVRLFEYWLVWARALLAEAEGRPAQALTDLYAFWLAGGVSVRHTQLHFLIADLVRLAAASGDRDKLREISADIREQAAGSAIPSVHAAAALAAGVATDDPELLAAAARDYERADWLPAQAQTCELLAVGLARAGRTVEARAALDRALNLYTVMQAQWDAGRARSTLRQLGVHRGVRGGRLRPKTGWEALTETERRVAGLVAAGHSNPDIAARMFLSRRTVQSHVSSILGKLGRASRVELAVEAAQHAGPAD
jgi:DNA-binding CsgD family transcriptional regulator/tetratricopeptide (TPR) repeat protein